MAEPRQSKTILLPREHNSVTRMAIGQEIINFIVRRTGDGIGVDGRPFPGYAKSYDKPGIVDLEESGQMMDGLTILAQGPGFVTIGYESGEANDKAAWIQRPRGQKLGKQPPREFLGISARDLNRILADFE